VTVVYTVSEHPLLSSKAKAGLSNEELAIELTAVAAQWLGVDETVYTGSALASINRAIVLQLNYMALIKPEMFIYLSEGSSHSKQSVVYREEIPVLYPGAVALVNSVNRSLGIGWGNIKAIR
jgi:hypothetical protein